MRSIEDRFWPKITVREPDECWPWKGHVNDKGYGRIGLGSRHDGMGYVHRVSWELHNGPVPEGLWVLHSCDNPPCVNPKHLFLGTVEDNNADMRAKGRGRITVMRRENHGMAKLTGADVVEIRKTYQDGGVSQQALARHFGVHQTSISKITRNEHWK